MNPYKFRNYNSTMTNEQKLIKKLQSIERRHAGAMTPGERMAAANALERIRQRLEKIKQLAPRLNISSA